MNPNGNFLKNNNRKDAKGAKGDILRLWRFILIDLAED
jgi:hypothetical protein